MTQFTVRTIPAALVMHVTFTSALFAAEEFLHCKNNFPKGAKTSLLVNMKKKPPLSDQYRSGLKQIAADLSSFRNKKAEAALQGILKMLSLKPTDPGYQSISEKTSWALNNLTLPQAESMQTGPGSSIYTLWNTFPSSVSRSQAAQGKSQRCIEAQDPAFNKFMAEMKAGLLRVFSKHPSGKTLSGDLKSVRFLPAGSKTYFGATADHSEGTPRICINPEEATPFLIPKLIHELTHAANQTIAKLSAGLNTRIKEWNSASGKLEEAEGHLYDFEAYITDESSDALDADTLMERLISRKSLKTAEIKNMLAELNRGKNPYKDLDEAEKKHAQLIQTWFLKKNEKKKAYQNLLKHRIKLDQERYLDEHRAYVREYQGAVHMAKESPEIFCNLWVPSFSLRRPVLFYQAYLQTEKRINEKSLSNWLADLYTFRAKSYLPQSVFTGGKKKAGIIPGLRQKALLLYPGRNPR